MGLKILQGILLQELLQVLIKMAMIIITILRVVKAIRRIGQMSRSLTDPHDLQRILAADAGCLFKVALQRTGRNSVLLRQRFNGNGKIIIPEATVQYFCNNMRLLQRARMLLDNRQVIRRNDIYSFLKRAYSFNSINNGLINQVTERKNIFTVLSKVDLLLEQYRRCFELDTKQLVARAMVTFNAPVTGEKAVRLHIKKLVRHLHYKRSPQVYEIGIANIGEQGIRKALRVLLPQMAKIGFPDKVNEMTQCCRRRRTVVIVFKMVCMEEFYVLHRSITI